MLREKTMRKRMFASYGAVAAATAIAATVLAAGDPEVKAVETHVDWSAPLDWTALADLPAPATSRPATPAPAARPGAPRS